ncbi:MAG: transposase, partial [Caldilineae bacterium]
MFRKNDQHLQRPLFSTLDELSPALRERLESSWAGVFRREVFQRMDETPFAVLYSTKESRPNAPVNVLLSLEILKAGFGWTDEELYDHFCFDLQVRYAVGYENLNDGGFTLRTLYGFRRRLARHMHETGENLVEAAFEQVTDEQIQA